jgi:hypothetical protein
MAVETARRHFQRRTVTTRSSLSSFQWNSKATWPSYQRFVPSEIQLMTSIKAKEKAGVWELYRTTCAFRAEKGEQS